MNAAPLASSLAGNASRVGQMLEFMDVMEVMYVFMYVHVYDKDYTYVCVYVYACGCM